MSNTLKTENSEVREQISSRKSTVLRSTELELIERAKKDKNAFGELYELHYNTILNYIYCRVLNIEIAEEITSNTFFKVIRALPDYHPKTSFKSWLYRIATNEIKMFRRYKRNRLKRENDYYDSILLDRIYFVLPEVNSDEERKENMQKFILIHEMLEKLPDRYRTALFLRFFEELKYEEIAKVLGKKVGTVKSLVHRGLKRMRIMFEKQNATIS